MDIQGFDPENYLDDLLAITCVEPNVYRGNKLHVHSYFKFAFGGHLMMQAISAALSTVPKEYYVNSLHNYFLSPGSEDPVTYHVENMHQGKTFLNRFVKATQNGKTLLNMQLSFKRKEIDSLQHQWKMPDCPLPENLIPANEHFDLKLSQVSDKHLKKLLNYRRPSDSHIEFRPVDPETMFGTKSLPPKRLIWLKYAGKVQKDQDQNYHRSILTYFSDNIVETCLLPSTAKKDKLFITSLDHSVWFHNDVDISEWLLYETESSYAGDGTGFNTGRFWTQNGSLIASVSQQCVIRAML
ncbi:acyl-coenzyme A thioesterase 8-like [Argonauta hians]